MALINRPTLSTKLDLALGLDIEDSLSMGLKRKQNKSQNPKEVNIHTL